MGEFDFLGESEASPRRTVVVHRNKQGSGCLPVVQVALGIILAVFLLGGGCIVLMGIGANELAKQAKDGKGGTFMQTIEDEVVNDAIRQYNTVARGGGSHMELSVQAGLVMAACAQAKDEKGYAKWKKIHDAHSRRAGIPVTP